MILINKYYCKTRKIFTIHGNHTWVEIWKTGLETTTLDFTQFYIQFLNKNIFLIFLYVNNTFFLYIQHFTLQVYIQIYDPETRPPHFLSKRKTKKKDYLLSLMRCQKERQKKRLTLKSYEVRRAQRLSWVVTILNLRNQQRSVPTINL